MTSNHLSRVLGLCAIGTLAIAGCGDGCGCEPQPTEDAGPGTSRLLIARPLNGATITAIDDEDALTDGIQITVEVRGVDVPEGTPVSLVNDQGGSIAPVAIADGTAVFSGVTLVAGEPPQGQVNELTASAGNHASDAVVLTVIGESVNLCRFLIPLDGATLSEDANALVAGFQTPVQVACSGTAIPADAPVTLLVNGGGQRQVALNSGLADFADVTLLEGANTLLAYTQNLAGNRVADVQIAVTVDTGACDAAIAAPAAGTLNASTTDLDPLTPEVLDLDLTVTSSRCLTGTVGVTVNGSAAGTGTLTAGTGQIRVALPQGSVLVVATVDDDGHEPGASASVTYLVDTLAPTIAVARPADGAVLGAADDEEVPPNPDNGLTYTVSGTVHHPEDSTLTLELTRDGVAVAGSPFAVNVTPGSGAFARTLANLAGGAYVATLAASDVAGNTDSAAVGFNVDLSVPELVLLVVSDQDANGVLNLAEDAAAEADYQVDVRVTLGAVPAPTSYTADVTLQPVDLAGAPSGQAIVVSQAFSAAGIVELRANLVEGGRYNITARARHTSGTQSAPTADRIVLVDFVPPALVINSPVDNAVRASRSLNLLATTPALDFAPTSPLLTINGTASSAAPTVSGGSITYAGLNLSGASDENYTIALTIADLAGNPATAVVHVSVDVAGPQVVLSGWASPAAASRLVALSASAAAPTELNTSTQPELDYSATTDGLQFGFKVVVSGETAGSLGSSPQARLDIQGLSQPLFAPLVAVAQTFEAVFDAAGSGIGLADGPLSFVATVTDGAGNAGSDTRHALVQTGQYYVRIDSPADGAYVPTAIVDVTASGSVFDGALCDLELDGSVSRTQAISGGALTFAAINLGSEAAHTLQVRCDIGGGDSADSLVHTVTVDVTPPATPAFALAVSDTAGHLPTSGFFNLAWASADAVRFVRDVQLGAPAEAGQCPYADPELLTTPTSPTGTAVHYQAQGQAGARWIVDGSDCVATFAGVDLGLLHDPGQQWTLRADIEDLAGNGAFVENTFWVDRVAPTLAINFPADNVTQLGNPYDELPGTPGLQMTATKRWTFAVSDRVLAGTASLLFSGTAEGVVSASVVNGFVRFSTDWLNEGPYFVTMTILDAAGNRSTFGPREYYVDLTAPGLRLYDKDNVLLTDGISQRGPFNWNSSFDISASEGGQFDFLVLIDGVRFPFEVRLCSDNPPAGAADSCAISGGVIGSIVARTQLAPTGGGLGNASFSSVDLPQNTHRLYVEADDSASNHASTLPVQVTIDTYAPTLSSISVVDNNPANDAACAPGQCLATGESPSDIVVTVSTAGDSEELAGRAVTLTSSNSGQAAVPTANLVGSAPTFTATFPNVTLAQGNHQLTAAVTDAIGNTLVTTGAVNPQRFVDTVAPSVVAHTPSSTDQYSASTFDVTIEAADGANPVEGYAVALTNATTAESRNATIATGASSALFAAMAMQDNASNSLSARVTDRVGNQSAPYNFGYDVDTTAPTLTLLAPTGPQSLSGSGACLPTDLFHVAIAGLNRTAATRLQLQSRSAGSGGAWGVVTDSDRAVSANSADLQLVAPEPCLKPGSREVRARIYETDTLHETVTGLVTIDVDLGVPVVTIRDLSATEVQTGHSFVASMDTNPAVGAYATALEVESLNAQVGSAVRLLVNGVEVATGVLGASNTAVFTDVVLRDFGATGLTNDIRAEVTDGADTGFSLATDCYADGDYPTIAFVSTLARSYLYDDDQNHAAAGVQAAAGNGLAVTTTGIDFASVTAYLSCTGMAGEATTTVASNAGEFVNMPGLLTSTTPYVCSVRVADKTGNEATGAATRTLTVDIDRPALPQVVACIGEDACHGAGCTPTESYEKDDNDSSDGTPFKCYDAATFGGACGNGVDGVDDTRCSRRGTFVTLTWEAPGDNGTGGGAINSYTIRYKPMAIAASPACSDMSGATSVDTSAMTIVTPGQQQSFTVTGLGVHKDYCFEVTASDALGNNSKGPLVLRRVPIVEQWSITEMVSGTLGDRTNLSGDLDGDGLTDVVATNYGYTEDAVGNRGRLLIKYSSGRADTSITYPTGRVAGTFFGWSASTGDFNGDGFADIVVSEANQATLNRLYLYFGADGGLIQSANVGNGDLPSLIPDVIVELNGSYIGTSLSNRPINFNGDTRSDANGTHRLDDIVATGRAWNAGTSTYNIRAAFLYRGRSTADWASISTKIHGISALHAENDADMSFSLPAGEIWISSIITGGDIDVDGRDDIVLPWWRTTGQGKAFVLFGRTTFEDLTPADGSAKLVFELISPSSTSRFAHYSVVYEGSGDSAADVAVFDNTTGGRRVHFFRGTQGQKIAPIGGDTNYVSIASGAALKIDSMGDISGDGIADLVVGDSESGNLMVYPGGSAGIATTAATAFEKDPNFGSMVCGGGDSDGDGYDDLIVTNSAGNGTVTLLR